MEAAGSTAARTGSRTRPATGGGPALAVQAVDHACSRTYATTHTSSGDCGSRTVGLRASAQHGTELAPVEVVPHGGRPTVARPRLQLARQLLLLLSFAHLQTFLA